MDLRLDHVSFAGSDLDDRREQFAAVGLDTEYGGRHGNGTTRMALVAFDDGSYVELVGPVGDAEPDLWPAYVRGDAGPCAWCLRVDDVSAALRDAADAGVAVTGPTVMGRDRPDGTRADWELGFLGDPHGGVLPMVISDRTPRSRRVPAAAVHDGPADCVDTVVVAVEDVDDAVADLRRLFGLPEPTRTLEPALDAAVAWFADAPVALAEPAGDHSWLADRLRDYGPAPCTVLLHAPRAVARDAYALRDPVALGDRDVAWFDGDWAERRLGSTLG